MKRLAVASTAERLAELEQQFLDIARMTKALRRRLEQVAETVRAAVDELGDARKDAAGGKVKIAAHPASGRASVGTGRGEQGLRAPGRRR